MRTKGPEEGGGISFKGELKLSFTLKQADFYAGRINICTNSLMALKLTMFQFYTKVHFSLWFGKYFSALKLIHIFSCPQYVDVSFHSLTPSLP